MSRAQTILIILAVFLAAGVTGQVVKNSQVRQESFLADQVKTLEGKVQDLEDKLAVLSGEQQKTSLSLTELQNRQVVKQKSQDELLTAAVAKVTPAVVSIAISKDVPKLKVVYQNPFGNDPFFKDFNIRIPVYQQEGVVRQKVGAGTGFLITTDGYILTNKHVVNDDTADYTVLLTNGSQKVAKVVYKDPGNDVAIVKIDGSGYAAAG